MQVTTDYPQPIPMLRKWVEITQHHFKEWVRREIIDYDPYDLAIYWDGEVLITEYENISCISEISDFDREQFLAHLPQCYRQCSQADNPNHNDLTS